MKKRRLPALRRPRITGGKCGPPLGNRNALKHGKFTRQRRAFYAEIRKHIRRCHELVEALKSDPEEDDVMPYDLTSILIGPSARPWMNWST